MHTLTHGDPVAPNRQLGIVDRRGRVASYTGSRCLPWAGGMCGRSYAVQGNLLAGPQVVEAMADAYEAGAGLPFTVRLVRALVAGDEAGGDRRGRQSAALKVWRAEPAGTPGDVTADLRVDDAPLPVHRLLELLPVYWLEHGTPVVEQAVPLADELAARLSVRLEAPPEQVESALELWASRAQPGASRPPRPGRSGRARRGGAERAARARRSRGRTAHDRLARLSLRAFLFDFDGLLFALEWGDVDRAAGVVQIRRAYANGRVKHTKTRLSKRAVPLQAIALEALDQIRPREDSPLLFPNARGGHLDFRNFNRRHWKPVQKTVGIEPLRGLYDLRHTYATFALRAGVPVFALSRFMGTSIAMIDLHYGHLAVDSYQHAVSRAHVGTRARRQDRVEQPSFRHESRSSLRRRLRDGEPCDRTVTDGSDFCVHHAKLAATRGDEVVKKGLQATPAG